ncbi:MAG TPA: hypothetical protein VGG06_05140 [Thermoanaerobaculia bacterium]
MPGPSHPCEPPWRRELAAIGVLLLLAAVYFTVLELREPYYFLWDDNASYHLPCHVYTFDSVFGHGELPHVNYHQYLGYTYLASGQPAVLYPPLYLGLAIARLGWGDLRAVVDVLAILHLVASALGMYALLRRLGLGRAAGVAASLLWMTLPFLVVVSRSWIVVAYAAAYLPWSLWLVERLLERPSAPRVLALGAVKALLFYQGYVQYAVLWAIFESGYLLLRLLTGRDGAWRRQALAYAAALAASAALAAPLLLPMALAKQASAHRAGSLSFAELVSNSLPVAAFLEAQVFRVQPRAVHLATGAIFYVGLPNLLALAALVVARRQRAFAIAAAVALAALVLSTRAFGVAYHLPVLSSFRWPFKSFLIAAFFLVVAAAGGYGALLASRRRWPQVVGVVLLAAAVAGNLAIVLSPWLDAPFGPNRVDRDVAAIRAETARRFPVDQGRAVSMWMTPLERHLDRLLAFDYATLAGAYHLGGYEPLIARENLELALGLDYSNIFRHELTRERLDHLSSWSVRFLVLPERSAFPGFARLRASLARHSQLRPAYRGDGIEVWENAAALPFAFFVEPEVSPVDVEWGPSWVRLATAGRGGLLRLNVAPLEGYVWTADGRDMGPVAYDPGRHLVIEVPPGARAVEVRYVDVPFRLGCAVLLAFLAGTAAVWTRRRWRRSMAPR